MKNGGVTVSSSLFALFQYEHNYIMNANMRKELTNEVVRAWLPTFTSGSRIQFTFGLATFWKWHVLVIQYFSSHLAISYAFQQVNVNMSCSKTNLRITLNYYLKGLDYCSKDTTFFSNFKSCHTIIKLNFKTTIK